MGRRKAIETEELIRLIDQFCLQHTDDALTVPALGAYIREQGIDIKDYTIRRDQKAKEYIAAIRDKTKAEMLQTVVMYHPLDVDAFLRKNRAASDMRNALETLDRYYASVANAAATLNRENKKTQEQNEKLKEENEILKQKLKVKTEHEKSGAIREREAKIHTLERLMRDTVYPALAKTVYEECPAEGVKPEFEEKIVKGDTEVDGLGEFENDFLGELFSNF